MDIKITPVDVAKKLSNMNANKSLGPDGAAPRVLKELQEIRQSIDQRKIPVG